MTVVIFPLTHLVLRIFTLSFFTDEFMSFDLYLTSLAQLIHFSLSFSAHEFGEVSVSFLDWQHFRGWYRLADEAIH